MEDASEGQSAQKKQLHIALRVPLALIGSALVLFLPTYAIGALLHAMFCRHQPGHPLLLYHYGIGFIIGLIMLRSVWYELMLWGAGVRRRKE